MEDEGELQKKTASANAFYKTQYERTLAENKHLHSQLATLHAENRALKEALFTASLSPSSASASVTSSSFPPASAPPSLSLGRPSPSATPSYSALCDLRGHAGAVYSVAFSPDGRLLASASFDGAVKLWSLESLKESKSLNIHSAHAVDVAFSPDATHLVSGGFDHNVNVVALSTATVVQQHTMRGLVQSVVYGIPSLPATIGACDSKGAVSFFDTRSPSSSPSSASASVTTSAPLLSNSSNINNSSGSSLTPTPGATHNQYIHAPAIHIVHEAMVNCLCAIGDFQIMCGDRHGVVRLYDLRHTEAPVHTLALASKAPITSIAAQAHRGVVAVNAYDNVVHILEHTGDGWVLAAESAAGVYRNKHWPIRGAFTRDGLYATGSADGNMVVLRYHALGRSVHVAGTMEAHEDKVFAVAAHPQRDVLASAGADSGIKVWQRNW